ncbi:MAG: DUF5711 family protein [Saccharofermentans sp.]|nr:DUF5711 family protein [Saccharofermentans sp.]
MDNTDYKIKNNKKAQPKAPKSLTIVICVLAGILVVSLVLIFVVSQRLNSLTGADKQIKLSGQSGFSCEYSEAQKLYPFSEGVLKVTGERISYLTISGNDIYTSSISYQNPQCVAFGDYAVVFDLDGYAFTLVDKEKVLYGKPTENKIKSVSVSSNGTVAIITESPTSYGILLLYDVNGTALSQWSSYNSGYPIACAFNDDSTLLAVSTLNTNGAVVVPYVRVFTLTSGDKGTEVADNAIYTTEDNVMFSSIFFLGEKIYCFTSNSIYQIQGTEISKLNFDFSAINFVTKVGDKLYIVYSDGVSQLNKLAIIDGGNAVLYNSDIGSDVNAVCTNGDLYAISIDKRIFIYKGSTLIEDISVDEDVLRMNFISGDKLCVVSSGGVHTVN